MKYHFIILSAVCLLNTACVSKKKYEETLTSHDVERKDLQQQMTVLQNENLKKGAQIDTLTLKYTRTKGANEALLTTQDKLLDRIDEVQEQLENERKDKSSTTQDLNSVVREKDQIIEERELELADIQGQITQFEKDQNKVLGEFSLELQQLFDDKQSVDYINSEIRITLEEDLLFRPGSARVRTVGIQNLQKIAMLMNKYPTLKLYVIGNTDNRKAKNYKDNWDYSVIRASNVVKVLTTEYQLSPSRVMAAGKGEFAPRASNETKEGQAANRRIDFVILPRFDRLIKNIKKKLEGEK